MDLRLLGGGHTVTPRVSVSNTGMPGLDSEGHIDKILLP
jgi:hypothetical protein